MTRAGKSLLIAGVLVAVAGSANAQQTPMPPTPPQQQLSYTPAAPVPAADAGNAEHFVKPPGYDQNPANYPYTAKGTGPKPN